MDQRTFMRVAEGLCAGAVVSEDEPRGPPTHRPIQFATMAAAFLPFAAVFAVLMLGA